MDYKIRIIRYIYFFSLAGLLTLYLFPGSLIGYFLYGDFGQQPNLIDNPLGTSLNHFFALFYLSMIGLISFLKDKKFKRTLLFLLLLSIALEISHFIIPNRSFEILDLLGNFFGFLSAYFIIFIYDKYKKNNPN